MYDASGPGPFGGSPGARAFEQRQFAQSMIAQALCRITHALPLCLGIPRSLEPARDGERPLGDTLPHSHCRRRTGKRGCLGWHAPIAAATRELITAEPGDRPIANEEEGATLTAEQWERAVVPLLAPAIKRTHAEGVARSASKPRHSSERREPSPGCGHSAQLSGTHRRLTGVVGRFLFIMDDDLSTPAT